MKTCCREYLLEQFDHDEDIISEIYAEYVSSLAQKIAEAETALAGGDFLTVDRAAHAMKGNALAAGDPSVSEVAIMLRHAAQLKENDTAAKLLSHLKKLSAEL